jgi:ACS family hexuronate transporter-like MFS transporter
MPSKPAAGPASPPPAWVWGVCALLLLATMLNYMDRLTLNQLASRINTEFDLSKSQYAALESAFGISFAFGAPILGTLVDRGYLRWLYPLVVLGWSAAGVMTSFVQSFEDLLICRAVLGFAEGGHFPCALKTTQLLLDASRRPMGNSLVQSGGAIGAVATPLLVLYLMSGTGTWRTPFLAIGSLGVVWVVLWLSVTRLIPTVPPAAAREGAPPIWRVWLDRRFWAAAVLGITLNCTWHFFRVWNPLFLQELPDGGYDESEIAWISSAFYLVADVGTLTAGAAVLLLTRAGLTPHAGRVTVYLFCAGLCAMSLMLGSLGRGPALVTLLLMVAFGSLGLFPIYYSFTQELSAVHQGKVTGSLSFLIWMSMAAFQSGAGRLIEWNGYVHMLMVVGVLPLVGLAVLLALWPTRKTAAA